jgi:hypothetical protein
MKEARVSKLSELAVLRALGCNVSSAHTSSRADIIKRFAQDELTMAGSPSEFGPLSGPKGGMKMKLARIAFALVMVLIGVLGSSAFAQDPGWPRQITKPGGTLVYYQPQVDSWSNFEQLDWRMAISIAPAGGKEIVGALRMHGLTSVNSESQMVLISNLQITNTYFPSLSPADAASMDQLVRTFVPPTVWISMQRLVACVPKPATAPPGAQLNNDPPQIFVGYQPSILLSVEGQPVLADIPNTKLQYVVNTEWAVFVYDKSTYYLLAGCLRTSSGRASRTSFRRHPLAATLSHLWFFTVPCRLSSFFLMASPFTRLSRALSWYTPRTQRAIFSFTPPRINFIT